MARPKLWGCKLGAMLLAMVSLVGVGRAQNATADEPSWEAVGWGGGGFFWSAAFHPSKPGVIYLGGDVAGVYKTEDHGLHWRFINYGLASYAVYSLAVDPQSPETVYAATTEGLCKSVDGGERWTYCPETGPKQLHITGERRKSVRAIAVDPAHSNIVFAATPVGKIYKSEDGATSWKQVYEAKDSAPIFGVSVSQRNSALVLAATSSTGVLLSTDAGATWQALPTPAKAWSATFSPADEKVLLAGFGDEGIKRSTDQGKSWTACTGNFVEGENLVEVAFNPLNAQEAYAIGTKGWSGRFYYSTDGGKSWTSNNRMRVDLSANPTGPEEFRDKNNPSTGFSSLTNLAVSPVTSGELFVSANWRNAWSGDGGRNWMERDRGADISCVHDIRFSHGRVYAAVMDEGVLTSSDNGKQWKQLWPLKHSRELSGHAWRLALTDNKGTDRIISTISPWDSNQTRVVVSEDGGKTYKPTTSGLPDYRITPNTMWGQGFPRALAVDPNNPQIVYLGVDGDPAPGKSGGGIFKSEDGGYSWKQLPQQPGSRRMFYALAVDPTDSKRIYWGACGTGGGLYRSEDGGQSWQLVFKQETWVFNVLVTAKGEVYCPGKNLWHSSDHGATWKKLTDLQEPGQSIVGLEVDPRDPKTLWYSSLKWGGRSYGYVYKTTDGGKTWTDITGNLPCRGPLILRFNPATNELWAGGVGLFRKQQ